MNRKTVSMVSVSLLAAFIVLPSARSYADPPSNHEEREDIRRDQRQLEELQRRRDEERREGDRGEAREYNEKMRALQRDMNKDNRELERDRHDRGRYDRDHDNDHD